MNTVRVAKDFFGGKDDAIQLGITEATGTLRSHSKVGLYQTSAPKIAGD